MKSEIQFFMREQDKDDFLTFVDQQVEEIEPIEHLGRPTFRLLIGDCTITFKPSPSDGDTLYAGSITIDTGTIDTHCASEEKAKAVWRKIKVWIKKHYWSRLAYQNKDKKNKLTPSRSYWVGPAAKRWKDDDPRAHIFKLSATSWVVFEIGI